MTTTQKKPRRGGTAGATMNSEDSHTDRIQDLTTNTTRDDVDRLQADVDILQAEVSGLRQIIDRLVGMSSGRIGRDMYADELYRLSDGTPWTVGDALGYAEGVHEVQAFTDAIRRARTARRNADSAEGVTEQ